MTFPEKLFVTGTDTDIGKTVISAMIVRGLKAGYWKPVQSGIQPQTDTEYVKSLTGLGDDHFYPETYVLNEPMSPHASAEIDGVSIRMDQFRIPEFDQKHLVIEGAGGLIVPLNEKETIIDLIAKFNIPILLVAKSGLGTLNHTLLSIEAIRRRNLNLWGVVMNGDRHHSNEKAIRHYGEVERLFITETVNQLNSNTLESEFKKKFL